MCEGETSWHTFPFLLKVTEAETNGGKGGRKIFIGRLTDWLVLLRDRCNIRFDSSFWADHIVLTPHRLPCVRVCVCLSHQVAKVNRHWSPAQPLSHISSVPPLYGNKHFLRSFLSQKGEYWFFGVLQGTRLLSQDSTDGFSQFLSEVYHNCRFNFMVKAILAFYFIFCNNISVSL